MLKLAFVALSLTALWQLCLWYTISDAQASQQRQQRAQLVDLDRQLDQFSFIPKLLSEDIEIREALSTPNSRTLLSANMRLSRTQQDSGLDVAYLLNGSGLTVASSNWSDALSFVGVSYSFRPYFKNAIKGQGATFFAVGVTTGIPGYFIAQPVVLKGEVLGVVVAKVELGVLVDSWSQLPYESVVTDEFGVIILSTREDLLYTPTLTLRPEQVKQLQAERRYQLKKSTVEFMTGYPAKRAKIDEVSSDIYFLFSQKLVNEPWQLLSLSNERGIQRRSMVLTIAIASLCLIAYLLTRLYQQQVRLVRSEQRHSLELEEKVLHRTKELETAQQRLISESNFTMLGRMSGAINHEINQPLASLRLNLASLRTMIENGDADQEEIEQIVIDSDRTTKRIGRVISSLRSLAQKNESRFERFEVARLINEVYDTVRRERQAVSRYLSIENADINIFVLGDEVLIQQALLNLLYNAFNAVLGVKEPLVVLSMQKVSGLAVRVDADRRSQEYVVICVSDNGPGISPSVASTLFEPFATTRRKTDGLGLGLTIARQIALDHGGELRYNATISGCQFTLELPVHHT
ncbi:MAG: two-component system C4-dicarboxylate transport sensor histidine kinase DctB [Halioglobus sp.]